MIVALYKLAVASGIVLLAAPVASAQRQLQGLEQKALDYFITAIAADFTDKATLYFSGYTDAEITTGHYFPLCFEPYVLLKYEWKKDPAPLKLVVHHQPSAHVQIKTVKRMRGKKQVLAVFRPSVVDSLSYVRVQIALRYGASNYFIRFNENQEVVDWCSLPETY